MSHDTPADIAVAEIILDGFNLHYWLFREYALKAREHFERGEWEAQWETSRARIEMYDQRVSETVAAVQAAFPQAQGEELWPAIKLAYIRSLYQHLQPEYAETFFNSVTRKVFTTVGVRGEREFVSAVDRRAASRVRAVSWSRAAPTCSRRAR